MNRSFFKYCIAAAILSVTSSVMAQTTQQPQPPKLDGSHSKDTSFSSTGASKNEVRGVNGQGSIGDSDTIPPKRKRKHPFPFVAPAPNNTNATNGSPSAPGQ